MFGTIIIGVVIVHIISKKYTNSMNICIYPINSVTLQRFSVLLLRFVIVYEKNINHKKR